MPKPKTLIHTNPHLKDPEKRKALIVRQAYESSVFEGARGLKTHKFDAESGPPARRASSKNKAKGR